MPLEILGEATDVRTGTRVIYAKSDIRSYIDLVGDNFDEFNIQRRRVKHKAYSRMREDIIAGALLPTISLAVKEEFIALIENANGDKNAIAAALSAPNRVNILDGLQRTHTLFDIINERIELKDNQTILLEFWLEGNIKNLIYRIIVLNAGQKPMSMRHQIELLFSATKDTLESNIAGLEVFSERDDARRTRPGKYSLERLSLSYYSYITKSPEIDKENIVAQQLQEDEILSEGEEKFGEKFDRFAELLKLYLELDTKVFVEYRGDGLTWIGSENVMLSFFSAAANFDARADGSSRVNAAIELLLEVLEQPVEVQDPLALEVLRGVTQGFNSRKVNVGFATRKLLFNSFREFFRAEGAVPLRDLWLQEAE